MDVSQMTLRQLEDELSRRKREDPLKLVYKPSEPQVKVHKSRAPITCVFGGNRTGKTYCAVAEALLYLTGRATYSETPDPPVTVWYVLPTSGQWERNVKPIWDKLCPVDLVARVSERPHMIRFKNGSVIHFMSADMRQRRLAGASVDLVICDEPLPETVFAELQARTIDRKGRMLLVMTPVDDKPDNWLWVRDKLYVPYETGERRDIEVIYMPVADADGNPLVPHFTREDIKRMEVQWPDPHVRAVRMYGHFVVRAGLVFGQVDEKLHVIKRFDYPDTWARWIVVDPQYHRFAALFFVADAEGNYYVTDEYYSQDEPLAYRAKRIKSILGRVERSVPCYVDSANPQDIAELNYHFNRIGAKIGAMPLPMQKRIEQMILRVQSMLEPQEERAYSVWSDRRGIHGAPRLMFFHDLISTWYEGNQKVQASRLMWELKRLTWDRDKPDKNSAGGADCVDALVYGCSVLQIGAGPVEPTDPYRGMDPSHAMIYRMMDRMDEQARRGEQWRWLR